VDAHPRSLIVRKGEQVQFHGQVKNNAQVKDAPGERKARGVVSIKFGKRVREKKKRHN